MALTNPCFKDQNWSHLGEDRERRKKGRRRGRRREEEKERRSSQDQAKRGMETTLSMYFVWITWNLRLDMVNILSLNLGF